MDLRYCCYSAIIGDYDLPPNVVEPDRRIGFFLLSDRLTAVPQPWQLVRVENYFCDPKITSGFLKSNPELLFGHHAKVVWVDGNLRDLQIDADRIDQWLASAPIAAPAHPMRSRVAEELAEVLLHRTEDDISATSLMARMRDEGFGDDGGLSETLLLVRDLADHRVRRADGFWWDAILSGARNDQLSFEFAVWAAGLVSARIELSQGKPSAVFSQGPHANGEGRRLAARSFAPDEIERRWCALNLAHLPANYPRPSYWREHWSAGSLQAGSMPRWSQPVRHWKETTAISMSIRSPSIRRRTHDVHGSARFCALHRAPDTRRSRSDSTPDTAPSSCWMRTRCSLSRA